MAELVPLLSTREWSTHYSDILHNFSVTIPRYLRMSMSTVSFLAQPDSGILYPWNIFL